MNATTETTMQTTTITAETVMGYGWRGQEPDVYGTAVELYSHISSAHQRGEQHERCLTLDGRRIEEIASVVWEPTGEDAQGWVVGDWFPAWVLANPLAIVDRVIDGQDQKVRIGACGAKP